MLDIRINEESIDFLATYAQIPISFEVSSIFQVQLLDDGLQGIRLVERKVEVPWIKAYDSYLNEGPTSWALRWDISKWGVISAFIEQERVGGCVIAYDTPGVCKLEGRSDIAALWDIRVATQYRGKGIGGRLLEAAIEWARRKECRLMKIETQNINVPACRFYARHGFTLGAINRFAYPELPDEVELIWCMEL